ncbi:MAG: MoxR family ATPase [Thiotrichales bacterium]|nr:MoxR family ATPase [Thiotrichales bacterium]
MEEINHLTEYLSGKIVGQPGLINRLLVALLADGHLLVEGAPGLAKTRAIKLLSESIDAEFHRIQFTPDLLPADLTGSDVFRPQTGEFDFQPGPLFYQIILADEVNRAPPKVQSALLEAMGERQITIGKKTYRMPDLFLVMATQNPLEHEGTYPLPEAQLDRFLMKVVVDYPDPADEQKIRMLAHSERSEKYSDRDSPEKQHLSISKDVIMHARKSVLDVHVSPPVEQYLMELVLATRHPEQYGEDLARWIEYGGSPRATIALDICVRAHAWLDGRDYVSPADVQDLLPDVLRHRLILSYEAESEEIGVDNCIEILLDRVVTP